MTLQSTRGEFVATVESLKSVFSDFWKGKNIGESVNSPDFSDLALWLYEYLRFHHAEDCAIYRTAILQVIYSFDPVNSKEHLGKIALYIDSEKRERNIRTACKPGRAFKKLLPEFTDSEIERLVDKWRARFPISKTAIHIGQERAQFRHAYCHAQAPMENPATCYSRKSLANSCMRYEFDGIGAHPSEAYASGDFSILWAENESGKIAARCVVWTHKRGIAKDAPSHAPIYGTSESVMDEIQARLDSMGAIPAYNWRGARLLSLPHGNGFIAPYLDVSPSAVSDHGDYLVIDSCGELDTSNAHGSGVIYAEDVITCDDCGDRLSEDDYISDDNGNCYCESCYNERFTTCEHCHDTTPCEDISEVYMTGYRGRITSVSWCCDCCDNDATRVDSGEYWKTDETLETADGSIISQEEFESDYFTCDFSDEIWHNDSRAETIDGESVYIELLRQDEKWQLQDSGLWELIQPELPFDCESVPVPVLCAPVPPCAPVPC